MKITPIEKGTAPEQLFVSIAEHPYPFFLDSSSDVDGLGKRSFVGADPFMVMHVKGREAKLTYPRSGIEETLTGNPFDLLSSQLERFVANESGPFPLAPGGCVGYFSYDLFPHLENIRQTAKDDLGMPDMFLGFYDRIAVFDADGSSGQIVETEWEDSHLRREWPAASGKHLEFSRPVETGSAEPVADHPPERFMSAVSRAKEYIAAGDVYQVNLSQRFTADLKVSPIDFYLNLRRTSPTPFGGCLFPDGFAVFSNSPERYLLIDGDYIETRPIKGTRPRGRSVEEDRELSEELKASEKDKAEHVMIVDLERNDLGRVCKYTTVNVPEFESIHSFANVHHMVSTVAGEVHPSKTPLDCIRNSFPGGSITGAPKVRAMEIIDELEPTTRGVYCGSVGYIDFSGRVDLNIAIRTAVLSEGKLRFQVGGGIVADSDPRGEYEETLTKAQSFIKVLTGAGRVWNGEDCG